MSEKKYVVPEEMYNAVIEVLPPHVRVQLSAMMGFPGVQRILEAALHHLSENPIVPTPEQMAQLKMSSFDWTDNEAPSMEEFIVEWQRRMFLAPEPEQESAYLRVTKAMGAVTLSEEEGNKILEFVKGAIHAGYRTTEPSVPEAVKDLGCTPEQLATLDGVNKEIAIRANNAIAEAYLRGQKEGSRA